MNSFITVRNFTIKIILYLLTIYGLWLFVNYLGLLILKNEKYDDQDINTFTTTLRLIFYTICIVILFIFLGLKKEFIVTYFSGFSLILAYSLQNHISDITAGLLLLYNKPIKINDYIELNENNRGFVKEISLFRTKITNIDNELISIANRNLLDTSFKRIEFNEFIFVKLNFGIPYKSDYSNIKDTINKLLTELKNDGLILRDNHEEMVKINNFDNSIYNIEYDDQDDGYIFTLVNSGEFNYNDIDSSFRLFAEDFDNYSIHLQLFDIYDNLLQFKVIKFIDDKIDIDEKLEVLNNKNVIIEFNDFSWIYNIISNRSNICIKSFDDSAVSVNVICKCKIQHKYMIYNKCIEKINEQVIAGLIDVPFPQLDLHVIDPVEIKNNKQEKLT